MGNPDTTSLLFSTVDGDLLCPRNVTKAWSRVMASLKMTHTFHALRHTHASMLIHKGVDVLTISRRLGHKTVAVTLDIYGHEMPGADKVAADAIAGVLK